MRLMIYEFKEHGFEVKGEKHELLEFVKAIRESGTEGTLSDLVFKIEDYFNMIE